MLSLLDRWCVSNRMIDNPAKSQIVHLRSRSVSCSDFKFTCGSQELATIETYVYLGTTLTQFLDLSITANISQSASRTLGLLIAKFKAIGGMPFEVYSKLYDSVVWPVIAYGPPFGGDQAYSCIEAVQNRALRLFFGVGRYTPTAGVCGDMGWASPLIRQWKCICNLWARYSVLPESRLNKRIFLYAVHSSNNRCKNWPFQIKRHLNNINCHLFEDTGQAIRKQNKVMQVTNIMKTTYFQCKMAPNCKK